MLSVIAWYLIISILGLASFPIAYRLFPALADRGFAFSRSLGLLIWGYIFWLLASLGILQNDRIGLTFSLVVLVLLSGWALYASGKQAIFKWLRSNLGYVSAVEILFLLAFVVWAFVRALNPDATGTEKPMELAFINAISRSNTFPPNDPWLSGYSISYYYFGYVLTAMLAGITGVSGPVAFNLGIATTFALSALGAYGLVHNLLDAHFNHKYKTPQSDKTKFSFLGLLGPLFLLLISNLEGFLHALHNRGMFWFTDNNGKLTSSFWTWLDIKDLNIPPTGELSWVPTRFWWWWRASRVVQDYDLAGNVREIIDEFPFFSYLLADLHPHVLAMPFALLAMAIAFNLILGGGRGEIKWTQFRLNLSTILWLALIGITSGFILLTVGFRSLSMILAFAGIGFILIGLYILIMYRLEIQTYNFKAWFSPGINPIRVGRSLNMNSLSLISICFVLGSIAFLNTWDMLLFVLLIPGSYALGRLLTAPVKIMDALKDLIWLVVISAAGAIVLYIPFFISFSSQAGGIIPNLIFPTRGAHLWVMFAPLLVPIISLLLYLVLPSKNKSGRHKYIKSATWISLALILFLWLISILLGVFAAFIPEVNELFFGLLAASDLRSLLMAAVSRRLISSGALITLAGLLILTLALLLGYENKKSPMSAGNVDNNQILNKPQFSNAYAVLLIFLGVLLVLGPEFIYLRDQFGWRINTIFKFYYQTWLIWSITAAYGSALLLKCLARPWSIIFRILFVAIVAMSLVYPIFSLWNKTGGFDISNLTLDSTAYLNKNSPDELGAINWLQSAPFGVIAEAVSYTGGSYTDYARISTHAGLPAVLGWIGHESQWRGGNAEMGSRQIDIERLYCSRNWEETKQILEEYDIRYVVVGALERTTYQPNQGGCPSGLDESKFHQYLVPLFQQGSVTIYRYASDGMD